MPIPKLTPLQFLILSCLTSHHEAYGHSLRASLRKEETKARSGPSFYMLMTRMENASLVKSRYERNEDGGWVTTQTVYRITKKGISAFKGFRKFVRKHAGRG